MAKKRVFILGAGFSKPAGMPLATDLTKCLLNDEEFDHSSDMVAWVESLRKRISLMCISHRGWFFNGGRRVSECRKSRGRRGDRPLGSRPG